MLTTRFDLIHCIVNMKPCKRDRGHPKTDWENSATAQKTSMKLTTAARRGNIQNASRSYDSVRVARLIIIFSGSSRSFTSYIIAGTYG